MEESEGERKLLPGAALDPGTGVVAGAGGDNHRRRLFAGPAAGEAELVVGGLLFHEQRPKGRVASEIGRVRDFGQIVAGPQKLR
jgi:hypothetical protein